MAKAWQLLLFASCSLTASFAIVLATGPDSKPLVPNTQLGTQAGAANKRPESRFQDLHAAASAADFSHAQPNIYHSIIDRSASLNRAGSPIQASANADADLSTAAGHHHGHAHGKYYEYREVPKKKTWKYGYKRGNHKHTIERHEHGKAGKHPHFKTKVKWQDKKSKGKGIHLWDYNHHDKKHGYHG